MIKHNELVIDGVKTSSFPFKVIVHDSPSVTLGIARQIFWNMMALVGRLSKLTSTVNLLRSPTLSI